MIRSTTAACLFLILSSLVPRVLAATSPQDQYLQIYLLIQEAEKLELSGQKASANERYQVAEQRLEKLSAEQKDWEPTIVNYRIRYCKDKLDKLKDAKDENPDAKIPPNIQTSNPLPVGSADDTAVLKKRVADLESELADTKDKLTQAQTEAAVLRTRVTSLETDLKKALEGSSDEKVAALLQENKNLKDRLLKAEGMVTTLQNGNSDGSVSNMTEQVKKIQDQLALAKQENEALRQTNEEYRAKLQEAQKQVDESNIKLAAIPKEDPLRKENEVLRGLIKRQMTEQTRREVAKRIALEELESLAVDSEKLKTQINILGSPLVELTDEEKALLKQPAATGLVMDGGNFAAPAQGTADNSNDYASKPRVPAEFKDTAREANELFAQQKFDEAAAKYQTILNSYPDSLYALSNLGVVRFQQGKYGLAEEFLRKAVKQSSQDSFSHSILGIALYQQGKYDDAVQVLTRAVALDPNDPKTHNYLGISASQKGWQEAAEQECRKAIDLDPKYGDAHFNLAVIYATQRPPSRELARRHYERALELGVPRDEQLEKLVYGKTPTP